MNSADEALVLVRQPSESLWSRRCLETERSSKSSTACEVLLAGRKVGSSHGNVQRTHRGRERHCGTRRAQRRWSGFAQLRQRSPRTCDSMN